MAFVASAAIQACGNAMVNGIFGVHSQANSVLNGYATKLQFNALASFSTTSKKINNSCSRQIAAQQKRYKNKMTAAFQVNVNAIMANSTAQLSLAGSTATSTCTSMMTKFTAGLTTSITKNCNVIISAQISNLNASFAAAGVSIGPYIQDVSSIVATANASMASVNAQITASSTALLSGINAKLGVSLNLSMSNLNSLMPKMPAIPALPVIPTAPKLPAIPTFQTPKFDFQVRAKFEASTSKYIQAKIPNITGGVSINARILAKTPDKVIIEPQLKADVNVTVGLVNIASSIKASITASVSSLIPTLPSLPSLPPLPSLPTVNIGIIASAQGTNSLTSVAAGVAVSAPITLPTSIPANLNVAIAAKAQGVI